MNILVLSAGSRNKIIQYFKKELKEGDKIIATDASNIAPAIFEADKFYVVPRVDAPNYLDQILRICKKEKINTVISLIDPELSLIAKNIEKFKKIGVNPIISDYEKVEMCFNKFEMYKFLEKNNFRTAKSYIHKDEFYEDLEKNKISFPIFVKPINGSASINTHKINSKEELEIIWKNNNNLMIQEFMNGDEYDIDAYIDMISKEPVALFAKRKLKRIAGETFQSVSIKDEVLFDFIEKFIKKAGFKGIINIDVFKVDGKYYISEVNPRFGGIYPHAYEAGVNVPKMIINNVNGIENKNQIGNYEEDIYMMKYYEVKIFKSKKG